MKKLMNNNYGSSIATYAVIMFGMIFILYLFGFTNMWDAYQTTQLSGESGNISIDNMALNAGMNLIGLITSSLIAIFATTGAIITLLLVSLIGGRKATATVLTFLIPAMILIVLNVFVFPVGNLVTDLTFANEAFTGTIITSGLLIFFNLFYILAVIEFIRGPS